MFTPADCNRVGVLLPVQFKVSSFLYDSSSKRYSIGTIRTSKQYFNNYVLCPLLADMDNLRTEENQNTKNANQNVHIELNIKTMS